MLECIFRYQLSVLPLWMLATPATDRRQKKPMKFGRLLGCTLLITSATVCGSVSAAVISFDDELSATQGRDAISDPFVDTTGIQQFILPGFNSSLGILTEINFTLSSTVSGDSTFMNTTMNSGTFVRGVQGFATVLGLGFALFNDPTAGPVTVQVSPLETVTAFFGPVSESKGVDSMDAGFLAGFIDPAGGTVSLDVNLNFNSFGTIEGDGGANFTGNITGFHNNLMSALQIDYIYTPSAVLVPEPTTLGLLGAGLLGLGFMRRRA